MSRFDPETATFTRYVHESSDSSSLSHDDVREILVAIITANWEADPDDRWIVPFGGGVGKIFAIGSQKMNGQVQAFYNVVKIDSIDGPDWSLRVQLQFLFPKG